MYSQMKRQRRSGSNDFAKFIGFYVYLQLAIVQHVWYKEGYGYGWFISRVKLGRPTCINDSIRLLVDCFFPLQGSCTIGSCTWIIPVFFHSGLKQPTRSSQLGESCHCLLLQVCMSTCKYMCVYMYTDDTVLN